MYGKTITTYLIDGSPTGIKTVELSNWIGKAIIIPRAKLKDAKQRPEVLQPALYFLFGNDEQGKKIAYIGEAENLINRIASHDSNKDFWDIVIAFISKDNNITKADVKYLEAKAIEKSKKINRFQLINGVSPIVNNLPEHQKSTMDEFLDNVDLLISAIGYPILKELKDVIQENNNENYYFIKARGAIGKGLFTEEGFIVLKGSQGPNTIVDSMVKNNGYAHRNRPLLFEKGIIQIDGENIVFQEDYLFSSPSSAGAIISGRSINGWEMWKNKDGKTLDEIERKKLIS